MLSQFMPLGVGDLDTTLDLRRTNFLKATHISLDEHNVGLESELLH